MPPSSTAGPYVVVAGTIGTGKSSVARGLGSSLGVPAFLEEPERNPFLESFYAQPERWAFRSQLWFLLDTCAQQSLIARGPTGGVQDHSADEGVEVYSVVLSETGSMSPSELGLLRQVFAELRRDLALPDVVLHLRARPEELLRRIRARDRPYERGIGLDYLRALDLVRDRLFAGWDACPVVEIDTEQLDGRTPEGLHAITRRIIAQLPLPHRKHGSIAEHSSVPHALD